MPVAQSMTCGAREAVLATLEEGRELTAPRMEQSAEINLCFTGRGDYFTAQLGAGGVRARLAMMRAQRAWP